jgi:hypothetical protein
VKKSLRSINDTLFGFLVQEHFLTSESLVVQTPSFSQCGFVFCFSFSVFKSVVGFPSFIFFLFELLICMFLELRSPYPSLSGHLSILFILFGLLTMKDCSKYGELMAILEDRVFFHSVCNQSRISKTNLFETTLL